MDGQRVEGQRVDGARVDGARGDGQSVSAGDHEWLQCRDRSCRLRFPVPVDDVEGLTCPACHGDLLRGTAAAGVPTTASLAPVVPGSRTGPPAAGPPVVVAGLLDNVRSVRNVGAALRTADAAGLVHVHLVGITAPGDHQRIGKTALGAEHAVAWSHHRHGPGAVAALRAAGWQVWVLEEGDAAEPLARACAELHAEAPYEPERRRPGPGRGSRGPDGPTSPPHVVVVVGHEVAGVDPAILAAADRHVAIPMRGTKRSLNVTVAFGIAVYALTTPGRALA